MRRVIAIVGPTAAGKTRLAVDLARQLDGEIVGADSRQVYRGMDIGTAKPTATEQAAARHHLIDVVEPDEPFSLGRWLELANDALEDIWSRGKQPLLVGGTGQYVWALLEGWRVPRVPPDDGLRAALESRPPTELIAELRRVDPEAEAFVDPRNVRRVVRALEVYHATGKPFSYWRTKEPPPVRFAGYRIESCRARSCTVGSTSGWRRCSPPGFWTRSAGYSREDSRASCRRCPASAIARRCEHLAGEIDLQTAIERTKTGTHRLARHQNAWFKAGDPRVRWIESDAECAGRRVESS